MLTGEQVSKLRGLLAKFRHFKGQVWLGIVQDAVKEVKKTWKHQVPVNKKVIEMVCIPLVVFDLSHTWPACQKISI